MSKYVSYEPQKHKGLPLYEIQSKEMGEGNIASVVVLSEATHEQAAQMPFYYMVRPPDISKNLNIPLFPEKLVRIKGGSGSGFYGHAGRPGKRGGSTPRSGGVRITGAPQRGFNAPTKRKGVEGVAQAIQEHKELADGLISNLSENERKKILAVEKRIREGTQTIHLHKDKEGNWTPERAKLHDEIIDKIMGKATPVEGSPEVVITGGLPGSGKSTTLKQRGSEFENYVHVDSDGIKAMFPEYEGWNATLLHEESSEIAGRIMEKSILGNYNVIYDATLKTESSAVKIVDAFEELGYTSKIIFTEVSMEIAMDRALKRFFGKTKRYVSLDYLATHNAKNIQTLNRLKSVADSWEHWDNSVRGRLPILISEGSRND